jgi:uncharacterized BrkB/YihY/UPF0761 family membrane protein
VSDSGGGDGLVATVTTWADSVQRRHGALGFPLAVVRKYGDDQGGRLSALMTYYGFLSIFPLLLLTVSVVSALLRDNADLREKALDAIVPAEFQDTVDAALLALPSGGPALVIGLVGLLLSGLGIVFSGYHTLNHVAGVPHRLRIPFFGRYVRIVAMLLVLVVGVIGVGGLTAAVSSVFDVAALSRLGAFLANTALLFLVLWTATMLLLPHRARLTIVWPAALLGSVAVTGVLTFGATVLPRLVARSGPVYGSFATIVGLFTLLFLVSQALVLAAEIAVVRRRRLWPRALDTKAPTDADRRALTILARAQERIPAERIDVRFDGDPTRAAG